MAKEYFSAEIKITGDKETLLKLKELEKKAPEAAKDVVAKTALNVKKLAGLKVNRLTSRLATSITIAMKDRFLGIAYFPPTGEQTTKLPIPLDNFEAIVGTGVDYAAAQEFTSRGKPYLLPALSESQSFMRRAVINEFKKLER